MWRRHLPEKLDTGVTSLLHVSIQVAFAEKLISHQVGVVRRGDEVAGERLVHVLVHGRVRLVKHAAVFGLHEPVESLKRQAPAFSGFEWKNKDS